MSWTIGAIVEPQAGLSRLLSPPHDIRAVRPRGGRGALAESPMHADEFRTEVSPDTRLGRRLSAGQPEAVGELYDLLGATIWSMARRAFPGAVAEEIVQDVLMQVWTHREQYAPGSWNSHRLGAAHCQEPHHRRRARATCAAPTRTLAARHRWAFE